MSVMDLISKIAAPGFPRATQLPFGRHHDMHTYIPGLESTSYPRGGTGASVSNLGM
jgi:hypothetical protein